MALLIEMIKRQAKQNQKTIVLPESGDERVIEATQIILQEKIAKVILLGDKKELNQFAKDLGFNIKGAQILDYLKTPDSDRYAGLFFEERKTKGITKRKAKIAMKDPNYFGTMMVKCGDADGMISGSLSPTSDVLRPALQIIKTAPGMTLVSGADIMIFPNTQMGKNKVYIFSDCAVNPSPSAEQLAEIANQTALSAKNLLGLEPIIAMLSFSTMGSARHETVDKVRYATAIAKERYPELVIDGELQLDAAIVPAVGEYKAPDSEVAGYANVLIFPDLAAGNIAYKVGQRMGNAKVIGPIIQGLAKPVNDLSRGCTVEEIVNTTAITVLQAQYAEKLREAQIESSSNK